VPTILMMAHNDNGRGPSGVGFMRLRYRRVGNGIGDRALFQPALGGEIRTLPAPPNASPVMTV
jgi:hypothetical protein